MEIPDKEINTNMEVSQSSTELEVLMENYSNMLLRTALLMLKDHKLAEDAVQETFAAFYRNAGKYRGEAGIKTYLSRILVNECRQRLRKAWFRRNILTAEPDSIITYGTDAFAAVEERMTLAGALIKLDTASREVLLLHYYNDLSILEICEVLKKPENTVKSRLKRGRDRLGRILREEFIDE